MHTKILVIGLALSMVFVLGLSMYISLSRDVDPAQDLPQTASTYRDATYQIEGVPVTLKNGVSEVEVVPGSASKTVTRYFGNELVKDMNGDGRDDVIFLVTQETGGSGAFFYVVAALKTDGGYEGTNAIFLGDRIAPQTIDPGPNGTVIVNFADRAPGESYDIQPSLGKSVTVLLDPISNQLSELVIDNTDETGWDMPHGDGKLKADVFTGTLDEVNTGCFADAECYVVVNGKHVTALRGWSRDTVGSVIGVEGFGDLEAHIGEKVEVYAQDLQDGTYTLYGSEGFYIKLITGSGSGNATGNQGIAVGEPNPSAPNPLASRTFAWVKTVGVDGTVTTPKKSGVFTLSFDDRGQVSGATDCNGFGGSVSVGNGVITFGPFMSTMMYCEGSQESEFTSALALGTSYTFDGSTLVIRGVGGKPQVYLEEKMLPLPKPVSTGDEPKPQIVRDGCMVGGCSGQLCGEATAMRDIVTTCEYRAAYACYQTATCERQASGVCGWTETKKLTQCLVDLKDEPVEVVY